MTELEPGFVVIGEVPHDTLNLDEHNANLGSERGMYQLEESLRQLGAGRSILLDKNSKAIAGNKTLEKWIEQGGKVAIVETDGHTLIAVRRRDLDLDHDPEARLLAFADNRVAETNLTWSLEQIVADVDAGINLELFWKPDELADIRAQVEVPDLDALDEKYGAFDETTVWPRIDLRVPPETKTLFDDLMAGSAGDDDHEKFLTLLHDAQTARL